MSREYVIEITQSALAMLKGIGDARIRKAICNAIDGLAVEPEKKGKPMVRELSGYYSIRVVGQRYRIIYCIDQGKVVAIAIAIGIRKHGDKKDVYALARKIVDLSLKQG